MKLLNKMLSSLFQQKPKNHYYECNTKIPTYVIPDNIPKIKRPDYDKLFSLRKYLERIDLSENEVDRIMNSRNPFGEAKNLFNGVKPPINWATMCTDEAAQLEKWIKVWSLRGNAAETVIESTFTYLLLHLGSECGWDTRLKRARYTEPFNRLDYIIRSCTNNDDQGILLGVDKEVMSCFALAHIESNKKLTEVIELGFYYLEKNTQSTASAQGSFYNYYGKEMLQGVIGKIIETAYRKNSFSLSTLFLKESRCANIDYRKLKYDISKMKKIGHIFSPNADQKEMVISDIIYMNKFIDNANSLTKAKIQNKISKEQIIFFSDKKKWDNYQFCHFTYSPNTPTGKAAKYPLVLNYYSCSKSSSKDILGNPIITSSINGNIYYLANGDIGKAEIFIFSMRKFYKIYILKRKGTIAITKIVVNKDENETELYNSNRNCFECCSSV